MWREKYLFYLTLIFIGGNLITRWLTKGASPLFSAICCTSALTGIITLSIITITNKKSNLHLFIPLFFLLGILNSSQGLLLGKFTFLKEASGGEFIQELRSMFSHRLSLVIPPEESAANSLLKALAMGNKGDLPQSLKISYRLSGAMHLLALSGLHVGYIYGGLKLALGIIPKFGKWGMLKSLIIMALLGFYAIFTGASPSICRAVLMAFIYETGTLTGREKHGLNSLSISALTICCIDPSAPAGISFQLSYCAMLGIFLIQPHLERAISEISSNMRIRKIWNTIGISISCQLATLPLTLFYFDSFPLVSLLTNLITMPVVTTVMTLAPFAIVTVGIPWIGPLASVLLTHTIELLNLMMEILSRIV
ncbi:MAG: ComEC/Rec2 family competence protein [Bacteroidales bacterium]|nr:ComEC/Rec2 family competence protein [Bacteroidales bacterium]